MYEVSMAKSSKIALAALLVFFGSVALAAKDTLCWRVFFKFPSEVSFPYFELEGVYKRTNKIVDNFPIYEFEQGGIYLKHSLIYSKLYFSRSVTGTHYLGLSARTKYRALDSLNWLATAGERPFDLLIHHWMTLDPVLLRENIWYQSGKIEAFCVDNFISKCTSNEIFFNNTFTNGNETINDLKTDYFSPLPGVYAQSRPVYQHTRQKPWYLFYADGHWIVGPDYNRGYGSIKVQTSVRRPEYVTKNWEYYNAGGRRWELFSDPVGMRCKGEFIKNGCNGTSSPCPADTECYYNMLNETVCKCKSGLSGPLCKTPTPRCPTYQLRSGYEKSAIYNDGYVGDYLTVFCDQNMEPAFTMGICQLANSSISPRWVQSSRCSPKHMPTTVATTTTPYHTRRPRPHIVTSPRKFNADHYSWIRPTVLSVVVTLQVIIPFFFLCCSCSCMRATSLFIFVSMIFWTLYVIGCAETNCGRQGRIFVDLFIMGLVVIILGYGSQIVESYFCSEREYVSMVMDGTSLRDFITMLRKQDAIITGCVECYHMETRTRTVQYTDASGNLQTRTESYQEQVTTYREFKTFHHAYFKDVSPVDLPNLSAEQVTRLRISKAIRCGDKETLDALNQFRDDLVEKNKHRDTYIVYDESEEIEGYREHVCARLDRVDRPFWLNSYWFWSATFLCLFWPYRIFFLHKTCKSHYGLEKEIYIKAPSDMEQTSDDAPNLGNQGPFPPQIKALGPGSNCLPSDSDVQETSFGYEVAVPQSTEGTVDDVPFDLQNNAYSQSCDPLVNYSPHAFSSCP